MTILCNSNWLHHLLITLDDVAGGMLNPHLFCKPIAKDQKIELLY